MKFWNKLKRKVRDDNERGARQTVLEELFNDFNRSRFTIYKFKIDENDNKKVFMVIK